MKDRCHIVMLTFNAPEVEVPCLESVIKHTNHPYEISVWDNRPENNALGHVWNRFIERCDYPYLCFLNSDVIISDPDWLGKLIEVFVIKPDAAWVGPITNNIYGPAGGYSCAQSFELQETWELAGFCMVIPKTVFNRVGLFDPEFGFYGQDTEWLYRVNRLYDLKAYIRKDVWVEHRHSHSISKNKEYYEQERKRGPELWMKKKAEIDAKAEARGKKWFK